MQILQKAKKQTQGDMGYYYCKVKYVPEMVGGVAWKRTRTEVWAVEKRDFIRSSAVCAFQAGLRCVSRARIKRAMEWKGREGAMEMDEFDPHLGTSSQI